MPPRDRASPNPWETEDQRSLLHLLIGDDYGARPDDALDRIRADKLHMAAHIAKTLAIDDRTVALEIGPGCGFITRPIAEKAKHVHACDVSRSFLDFAQRECASASNVTLHHVEPLSLAPIADASIDVAYANSVFIHFNLFDVYWTLRELHRVLVPGGRVWFDIASSDGMDPATEPYFLKTANEYRDSPQGRGAAMVWISREAVISIAEETGFDDESFSWVDLIRTAHDQKRTVRDVRREVLLTRRRTVIR
jgi:SAM-dependent methyltransferase